MSGEWIEWYGGECPVLMAEKVEVVLRTGKIMSGDACRFVWAHALIPGGDDIVRYRFLQPEQAPTPTSPAAVYPAAPPTSVYPTSPPTSVYPTSPPTSVYPATATAILGKAAALMEERSKQYDQPQGERSMGRAVAALNVVLGRQALTESEGWLLLQLLKDVRDRQRAEPHPDSLEDGVAYAALKVEARLQETGDKNHG